MLNKSIHVQSGYRFQVRGMYLSFYLTANGSSNGSRGIVETRRQVTFVILFTLTKPSPRTLFQSDKSYSGIILTAVLLNRLLLKRRSSSFSRSAVCLHFEDTIILKCNDVEILQFTCIFQVVESLSILSFLVFLSLPTLTQTVRLHRI